VRRYHAANQNFSWSSSLHIHDPKGFAPFEFAFVPWCHDKGQSEFPVRSFLIRQN
jgi:hypothetical protein